MRDISAGADTVAGLMPGHRAQDILSDENWDDWPDFELLGDEEQELDSNDDPEVA
jgi:hypothetical protein